MAMASNDLMNARIRRAAIEAPMLDLDTEQDYLCRIQESDDPVALNALIVSHLRLVLSIAQKYTGHGIALEDLVSEGNLGLVEAARRFDRSKGTRFSTYAGWWVRALVRRHTIGNRRIVGAPSTRNGRKLMSSLRQTQRAMAHELGTTPSREQIAARLGVSVEDVAMVESALSGRDVVLGPTGDGQVVDLPSHLDSPEQQTAEAEIRRHHERAVAEALGTLDVREREIVERRFLCDDKVTLAVIGKKMGLSRERVRQIELRACQKLRDALLESVA